MTTRCESFPARPGDAFFAHHVAADAPCPLFACKTCTPCVRNQHKECRRLVTCPTTGEVNACTCCQREAKDGAA